MDNSIFILIVILIFIVWVLNSNKRKSDKQIDNVFKKMNDTLKPIEKHQVIEELFIKSATHVNQTLQNKNNLIESVYTAELVLHIFALWVANHIKKLETKEQKDIFFNSVQYDAYIILIKEFLNLLIEKGIGQKGIDNATIKLIILSRLNIIMNEQDFSVRCFNFINLCELTLKYEDDSVFWIGKHDDLPFVGGNPLDMVVLPSAYKAGLIDEFLEKLEKFL